jgi:hypothetical protein
VQDQTVWTVTEDEDSEEVTVTYSLYTGSGTVKLGLFNGAGDFSTFENVVFKDIGSIKDGSLEFDFANYGTPTETFKLSDALVIPEPEGGTNHEGNPFTETITEIVDTVTISSDVSVAFGALVFVEEDDPYYMSFGKETWTNNKDRSNGNIWYVYAYGPVTIQGTQSYTRTQTHPNDPQDGYIDVVSKQFSEYDITLKTGWNLLYNTGTQTGENHKGEGNYEAYDSASTTAPTDGTADWKWALSGLD